MELPESFLVLLICGVVQQILLRWSREPTDVNHHDSHVASRACFSQMRALWP